MIFNVCITLQSLTETNIDLSLTLTYIPPEIKDSSHECLSQDSTETFNLFMYCTISDLHRMAELTLAGQWGYPFTLANTGSPSLYVWTISVLFFIIMSTV